MNPWGQESYQRFLCSLSLSLGQCLKIIIRMNCSMILAYKSCHIFFSCSIWVNASCSLLPPCWHKIGHYSFEASSPPSAPRLSLGLPCCKHKVFSPQMGRTLLSAHCSRFSLLPFTSRWSSAWGQLCFSFLIWLQYLCYSHTSLAYAAAGLFPITISSTPRECSAPPRKPWLQPLDFGL